MIVSLVLAFVLSFLVTGLFRSYALRKSIIDIPNDRSSHTVSTPRGGGIAIAIAWFAGLAFFFIAKKIESQLFYALLSGLPLVMVGFADDIFTLSPRIRFIVQALCAFLGLFFLGGLESLGFGYKELNLTLLLTPLAFIAIIWAINLFNFLDGIDGYIGTEVVFIGLSVYFLSGDQIGLLLAVATLGFLFWNWEKAKIFMGDVGSTLLGYNVAIMTIYHQNNHISTIPVWLILTSVFWVDATITLLRRIRNREKLSLAHRKHAYQRIVQSGFSHQKTVLWALGINLIGFILAWLSMNFRTWDWLFLFADLILLFFVVKYIDKVKAFE